MLRELILFIAQNVVGPEAEVLADEVSAWIDRRLGPHYAWSGNIRQLEQCVRSVLVHRRYEPPRQQAQTVEEEFLSSAYTGRLTADECSAGIATLVYAEIGSYEKTARRLDLDRCTVKRRVDEALLARQRASGSPGSGWSAACTPPCTRVLGDGAAS